MKRYFVFDALPPEGTYQPRGQYHWMDLPGGGYVVVVEEESSEVPSDWRELPHLLESVPAGFNGTHAKLGDPPMAGHTPRGGCLVTDTTFQVVKKLSRENPLFRP